MIGRRTPEQLAARDNLRRAKARGPEAVAAAERLKTEVDAEAKARAAQAKADEVIASVAEPVGEGPMLRVAVTDPETGQRLATGFVSYGPVLAGRHLRTVTT